MGIITDQAMEDVASFWEQELGKNKYYCDKVIEEYSVAVFLSDDRFNHSSARIVSDFLQYKIEHEWSEIWKNVWEKEKVIDVPKVDKENLIFFMEKKFKYLEKNGKTKIPWKSILDRGITEKGYMWSYNIALKFGMDFDLFLKLLNSIEGESIDYRNPQEMIYALCIAQKKTYEQASELLKKYKDATDRQVSLGTRIQPGYTQSLDAILHENHSEEEFISELVAASEQYGFKGLSITNTVRFVRLIQYVWGRYKSYPYYLRAEKKGSEDAISENCEISLSVFTNSEKKTFDLIPAPDKLFFAMTGAHFRQLKFKFAKKDLADINEDLKDLRETLSKEDKEKDDRTKGKNDMPDIKADNVPLVIERLANELYFELSERTYQKAYLLYGEKYDEQYAKVKRKDVLIYLHFLISDLESSIGEEKVNVEDLPSIDTWKSCLGTFTENKELFDMSSVINSFDSTMQKIQDWILDIKGCKEKGISRDNLLRKYLDIFDEVLREFGFTEMYLPNLYDRYFCVNLLSDDPDFNWDIKYLLNKDY